MIEREIVSMIFKFKAGDAWRIIDNIDQIDLLPFKDGDHFEGCSGAVCISRNKDCFTQPFAGVAYVMNDKGQTIERVGLGLEMLVADQK